MCTGSRHEKRRSAPSGGPLGLLLVLGFELVLVQASASAADSFSTDWAQGAKSRARIIADGRGLAGFEIRLAPGAITYWRNPGDAGLPPGFDFSGSENVAKVAPLFPAPKRITEADGGEAFGYDGDVILPLRVQPVDPAKPVTIKLKADFAVCEKVCLPAKATLELALPTAADSPYRGAIDAALASVPRVVSPNDFGALDAVGADSWLLCAPHEDGPPRDLFVEPPEGWWIKVAPVASVSGQDCFKLTVGDKPKDATLPVPLRLTLTGGAGAVERTIDTPLLK
jgi:DsbC/DsbD-like thiol-disulfide interchange protein